ncbi:hypothetical protein [Paraburkholderia solisilvae]|uniref:Uncharacterized protein n=1 Tax=Paraburkholderia solisilvae TaxID=624376 RepID=A0A6J5CZ62_9BURK|nr:hypothetical protein [Paraburkholderia solisilvae]CAB3746431.1 hypothetical protein LMG29739_00182 [Paraburkholderia solisilvae]
MIRLPALHEDAHVTPDITGAPETGVPPFQRQSPPQDRNTRQSTGRPLPQRLRGAGFSAPARQTRLATGTAVNLRGPLPDAYIGTPKGDLRSDPRHAGVVLDESGQPYVPLGGHYYAIRNDPANGTWRAVQLQDPAKPGIPVRRDPAGAWQVHADVGAPGGRPVPTRAQIDQDLQATRASLDDLIERHVDLRQEVEASRDVLHRHEAFQQETLADLQSVRDHLDLSQGMADYFARQVARGDADPSFRTALEQAEGRVQHARSALTGLLHLIDESEMHIDALQSRIATSNAELRQIVESIVYARQRLDQLRHQLDDFE